MFRLYEVEGTPTDVHLRLPRAAIKATETNLMEAEESELKLAAAGAEPIVPTKRYEIKSVKTTFGPGSGKAAARQEFNRILL